MLIINKGIKLTKNGFVNHEYLVILSLIAIYAGFFAPLVGFLYKKGYSHTSSFIIGWASPIVVIFVINKIIKIIIKIRNGELESDKGNIDNKNVSDS